MNISVKYHFHNFPIKKMKTLLKSVVYKLNKKKNYQFDEYR